jgi:hypothetical protein
MVANEAERWDVVQASEHERWLARPFDDPNGVELIVLSKDELLHALPRTNPCVQEPPPVPSEKRRATVTLNIRTTPSTAALKAGSVAAGTVVDVTEKASADGYDWRRLADGRGWVAERNAAGVVYLVNP